MFKKENLKLRVFMQVAFIMMMSVLFLACSDDDTMAPDMPDETVELTGVTKTYQLAEIAESGVSGTAVFAEVEGGSTIITLSLDGTPPNGDHPAHIHFNSAAIGGDVAISLSNVDGATGESVTTVEETNAGTVISYDDLLEFDGYINVHLSATEIETIVAQGDIGINELTGETKTYELEERAAPGISGNITFAERLSGFALATISLQNTPEEGVHPAHIHMNSAAIGGNIIYSFNAVNGSTGMSVSDTEVGQGDNEASFTYAEILDIDGYVNVHLGAGDQLATIVAQGDIGINELTGESKMYELEERAAPGISGSITFEERLSGFALATISLQNTPEEGMHPAHIHANSAAIGGNIIYSFNAVNGATGMSVSDTEVGQGDNEASFTYAEILELDGYVNVHLGPGDQLATIVAQGDIGINELTGESKTYELEERAAPGISGNITFEERLSGFALATINLQNTPEEGMHPAHIHMNSAAIGGGIIYSFNAVNGATGMSVSDTEVGQGEDEASFTYDEILAIDGYVNVHLGPEDQLATIVAQGDIGINELTGESITYPLEERAVAGISGNITFAERLSGFALATISLQNTPEEGIHPAHIHANSAAVGGGIIYSFNVVNGATGISISDTEVGQGVDEASFTYAEILEVDGYVNVHLGPGDQLATIVAQGDIGSNF